MNPRVFDIFYKDTLRYLENLETLHRRCSSDVVLMVSSHSEHNFFCDDCSNVHNHSLLMDVGIKRRIETGCNGTAYYITKFPLSDEEHTNIIKRILQAGIKLNTLPSPGQNALLVFYPKEVTCNWGSTAKILYAAGSVMNYQSAFYYMSNSTDQVHEKKPTNDIVLDTDNSPEIDNSIGLKHMCRMAIRNNILKVRPHENLFVTVPKLGLPSLLSKYVLFDMVSEIDSDEKLCIGAKCYSHRFYTVHSKLYNKQQRDDRRQKAEEARFWSKAPKTR